MAGVKQPTPMMLRKVKKTGAVNDPFGLLEDWSISGEGGRIGVHSGYPYLYLGRIQPSTVYVAYNATATAAGTTWNGSFVTLGGYFCLGTGYGTLAENSLNYKVVSKMFGIGGSQASGNALRALLNKYGITLTADLSLAEGNYIFSPLIREQSGSIITNRAWGNILMIVIQYLSAPTNFLLDKYFIFTPPDGWVETSTPPWE